MKKSLFVAVLFVLTLLGSFPGSSWAAVTDPFTFMKGNVVLALTQEGTVTYEYGSAGQARVAVLDSIVRFIPMKGNYLLTLDGGVNGTSLPGETSSLIGATTGLRINLNAPVNAYGSLSPAWVFLQSLQYGPRIAYESEGPKHYSLTFAMNYAFGPATPK